MHKCRHYLPDGHQLYVSNFASDIFVTTKILLIFTSFVFCLDFHFRFSLVDNGLSNDINTNDLE